MQTASGSAELRRCGEPPERLRLYREFQRPQLPQALYSSSKLALPTVFQSGYLEYMCNTRSCMRQDISPPGTTRKSGVHESCKNLISSRSSHRATVPLCLGGTGVRRFSRSTLSTCLRAGIVSRELRCLMYTYKWSRGLRIFSICVKHMSKGRHSLM